MVGVPQYDGQMIVWYNCSDDERLLPVLVYIHGGMLQYGSGNDDLYSPSAQLANQLNSVIVSFNYRLGVFGWLAVEVLQSIHPPSPTYNICVCMCVTFKV